MTVLRLTGDPLEPESECDECGVYFTLWWRRDGITEGPEFCPFCGEEIDEVIDETEDNQ